LRIASFNSNSLGVSSIFILGLISFFLVRRTLEYSLFSFCNLNSNLASSGRLSLYSLVTLLSCALRSAISTGFSFLGLVIPFSTSSICLDSLSNSLRIANCSLVGASFSLSVALSSLTCFIFSCNSLISGEVIG